MVVPSNASTKRRFWEDVWHRRLARLLSQPAANPLGARHLSHTAVSQLAAAKSSRTNARRITEATIAKA